MAEGGVVNPEKCVVFAEGKIMPADKSLIASFLEGLGLNTTVCTPDQWIQLSRLAPVASSDTRREPSGDFNFSAITTSETWLVREHLDDYRYRIQPNINPSTMTRFFNALVNGAWRMGRGSYAYNQLLRSDFHPLPYPGITVKSRKEVGIAPYVPIKPISDILVARLAQYAVQVGSILDTSELKKLHPPSSELGIVLHSVVNQLDSQVA